MKRKFWVVLLIVSMLLVACSSDSIKGKWEGEGETIEFTNDEFYVDGELVCNYHVDDDTLVLEYEGMEFNVTFKVDGDTLTVTDEGESMSYERID